MSLSFHTLSNLVLNMLVVLADTAQLGKLFHIFTNGLEKPYGLNFAKDFLESQIISAGYMQTLQHRHNT